VAAHDLKEPLRKILAFGGRLEQATAGILDEKSVGYLQRMQGAAARLEQLVESLLAFTRVSTRGRPFEAVDLEQVVDQVCGDFEESIAESDCQILYSELPTVHADPHQVRQLLQNLVGNALKYRRPDERPVIMIRAEDISADDQAFCRIEVTDNGIGFDADYAERIFVIFERLHARSEIPGTGIGLAVCRRIVERHGGTITAEGRPGRGATFRFTLPAGPAVPDGVAGESGDRRAPARRGVVRLLRHHGRDQTSTSPSADGAAKTWEGTR
jgi:light-regulated signal transduction histidine kinase (bacteriophytochrome)